MSVRVDVALPYEGMVTGLGTVTVTPLGAVPTQAADKLTVELNPFTDENSNVVDFGMLGVKVIAGVNGWVMKSGLGAEITVPAGSTVNSRPALCDSPVGLVAVRRRA